MSKITPEMVEEAMDNQYDGIEDCVLVEEILQLKAENKRLRKRDCNADIVLCFNDGNDPFAREDLQVVDVGVSDNRYVVESQTVTKLQAELADAQAENKQLRGEEPIPFAWWAECPKLAQRTMERTIGRGDQIEAENDCLREALGHAKTALLNYNPSDDCFPQIEVQFNKLIAEIEQLLLQPNKHGEVVVTDYEAENKRLREFARFVIEQECWSIFEQDGGDIQELAEKLGLIVPHIVTKDEADDNFGEGDTKFLFSEAMKENDK